MDMAAGKMPWGRFAGRPLDRLPLWYLTWVLEQPWVTAAGAALEAEWDRRFPSVEGVDTRD